MYFTCISHVYIASFLKILKILKILLHNANGPFFLGHPVLLIRLIKILEMNSYKCINLESARCDMASVQKLFLHICGVFYDLITSQI